MVTFRLLLRLGKLFGRGTLGDIGAASIQFFTDSGFKTRTSAAFGITYF